jgi:hypothetical protein
MPICIKIIIVIKEQLLQKSDDPYEYRYEFVFYKVFQVIYFPQIIYLFYFLLPFFDTTNKELL